MKNYTNEILKKKKNCVQGYMKKSLPIHVKKQHIAIVKAKVNNTYGNVQTVFIPTSSSFSSMLVSDE